jgi:hypothetical protein
MRNFTNPNRLGLSIVVDIALLAVVFFGTVGIAQLAHVSSLGVATGIGQLTFTVVLIVLLLRR